jgi:hypothetical protein
MNRCSSPECIGPVDLHGIVVDEITVDNREPGLR